MRAIFINLDRARDRRRLMERQGELRGIPLERARAVEPGDFAPGQFERQSIQWERPLRPNELAIFLSHLALWRQAADTPEGLVVLEDDAILSPAFAHVIQNLPQGFDLITLEDVNRDKFFSRRAPVPADGFVVSYLARERSGAGGYWISQAGARKLVQLAETRAAPSDAFMFGLGGLKVGQVEPAPVNQVHLLAEDGLDVGLATASTSNPADAPKARKARSGAFFARKIRTQAGMAWLHLRRLWSVTLRRPAFDRDAFERVLPIQGL